MILVYCNVLVNLFIQTGCAIFCQKLEDCFTIKMFEGLFTNIKRRFSKTSLEVPNNGDHVQISGLKRSLHLLKTKFSKQDVQFKPEYHCDDTALSPRATGTAECAETEFEWPVLADNNILDKFTRIVTITEDSTDSKNVLISVHICL